MKIEHIAIWTNNLERSCQFYETYFNGEPRLIGDGYYEGIIANSDENRIEIVV